MAVLPMGIPQNPLRGKPLNEKTTKSKKRRLSKKDREEMAQMTVPAWMKEGFTKLQLWLRGFREAFSWQQKKVETMNIYSWEMSSKSALA